jgi:hypothetical protein
MHGHPPPAEYGEYVLCDCAKEVESALVPAVNGARWHKLPSMCMILKRQATVLTQHSNSKTSQTA